MSSVKEQRLTLSRMMKVKSSKSYYISEAKLKSLKNRREINHN